MTDQAAVEAAGTGPDHRRGERWGWTGVALLTAVVAASWAPYLNDPLGDNRAGRITGRYAIQLRNLLEKGLIDSHWGTDWSPYNPHPYAHHPPLRNLLDLLFSVLPGDGVHELRIAPFLLTLLAIPAAAGLLRGLEIRWVPTLLAVGLMVVTGYFWVYGPLLYDIGLILALSALVVLLRRRPQPAGWLVAAACATALLTTLHSWPGIAFAAVLGLWLFAARRLDRVTVAVAASMVAGVAVSLSYVVGISGTDNLLTQAGDRSSVTVTGAEFAGRQWQYFSDLLPPWYLILLPLGVIAGLATRRTRFYTALATGFAAGWLVVLDNGAYVHDYWGYPILIAGVIGMGALAQWLADRAAVGRLSRVLAIAGTTGLVGLLGVGFGTMVFGDTAHRYLASPASAGQLVIDNPPAAGQQQAWHYQVPAPRWYAYYWDLHQRQISPRRLADEARPDDLVLLDLDRLPQWLPESVGSRAVARQGHYALFRAEDLLDSIEPD